MASKHADEEIRVSLTLFGDFDPAEITRFTGLTPTSSREAGELLPHGTGRRVPTGIWSIQPREEPWSTAAAGVRDVLRIIEPARDRLAELGWQYDMDLHLTAWTHDPEGPELILDPELVARIAELNASLGLDTWCDEDAHEDERWVELPAGQVVSTGINLYDVERRLREKPRNV